MTATEIIQHFESEITDSTVIYTEATNLNQLGWDFGEDYDNWKDGNYSGQPYSKEDLLDYDAYLESTIIYFLVKEDGYIVWGSMHRDITDRIPDGWSPTGNDKQTFKDISENLDDFLRN